jgi:hypothetical protein
LVVSASECAASASSALEPEITPPTAFVKKIVALLAIATSTVLRVLSPTPLAVSLIRADENGRRQTRPAFEAALSAPD